MNKNMSGKSAKLERKEKEERIKDYETRRDALLKELNSLSSKYMIDLVAVIQYKDQGAIPAIAFVDSREKYEHITEEAKKAMEMKKQAGNLDLETPNGEAKKSDVPKLEV